MRGEFMEQYMVMLGRIYGAVPPPAPFLLTFSSKFLLLRAVFLVLIAALAHSTEHISLLLSKRLQQRVTQQ